MERKDMNSGLRHKIEQNIFPAALPAVEPWDDFQWHLDRSGQPDTHKEHSSQALAISLFGTIKVAARGERDAVLAAVAREVGVPSEGPWDVELEWTDDNNTMRERRKTQVDALATSPSAQILFECKFTEADGGACSQKDPIKKGPHKGVVQCNGNFEPQTNPLDGRGTKCILAAKGIRYWEIVPEVFTYDADACYRPCPFKGPWYQWMRNLTVAYVCGRASGRTSAFVVSYADAPGLPMAHQIGSKPWEDLTKVLRPGALPLKAISVQRIATLAAQAVTTAGLSQEKWRNLSEWVASRISKVVQTRAQVESSTLAQLNVTQQAGHRLAINP
jgi:hypothetical protein